MFFRLYNHLIFSICCQPSTPTLQEHNLLIPKVFLNWKGFWLHHCSFQTCAKFPESLRLHFLCNTTNIYRTDSPPFFSPPRIQLTCSSTTAAFLSASAGIDCPIQGFPPRAGKWTRPQTLTRSRNRRRTSERRKSLTWQTAVAASGLLQAVKWAAVNTTMVNGKRLAQRRSYKIF